MLHILGFSKYLLFKTTLPTLKTGLYSEVLLCICVFLTVSTDEGNSSLFHQSHRERRRSCSISLRPAIDSSLSSVKCALRNCRIIGGAQFHVNFTQINAMCSRMNMMVFI